MTIEKALEERRLKDEIYDLRMSVTKSADFMDFVGVSEPIQRVYEKIKANSRVANRKVKQEKSRGPCPKYTFVKYRETFATHVRDRLWIDEPLGFRQIDEGTLLCALMIDNLYQFVSR